MEQLIKETAGLIQKADAMVIFAGAGMGVDSGLEQYRGEDGLWTKALEVNGQPINYYDLMTPLAFKKEPGLAWGLIGYLTEKYMDTDPHEGFVILRELLYSKEYFIVTSNIDQQFQKAGFSKERIFEFHGSIFRTQCGERLECGTWETPDVKLDSENITALPPLPVCPVCNNYCRPNIHLFDDENFASEISAEQQFRYMEWRSRIESSFNHIVALEIGAGLTIPTIRWYAERFAGDNYPLIRVNPDDSQSDQSNHYAIPIGAADYLRNII